jgi:hypothetical protein
MKNLSNKHTFCMILALLLTCMNGNPVLCRIGFDPGNNPVSGQNTTLDAPSSPDSTLIEYYNAGTESWSLDVKFIYLYDEKRNRLQSLSFVWDEDKTVWRNRWKDDYTRDANDYLVKDIFSMWNTDSAQWYETEMWEYTNDENGIMVNYLYSTWDPAGSKWKKAIKGEYSLDDNGKADSILYYTWVEEPGRWINLSKNEMAYDSRGNLTEKIAYAWDTVSNSWINDTKSTLFYDVNSLCTEWLAYKWDTLADDWLIDGKITYSYDAGGNQTGFVNYFWDKTGEQWIAFLKFDYTYDGNGNRLTETGFEWIEDEWIYNQRRNHYYPQQSSLDHSVSEAVDGMMLFPNPASGNVTICTGHPGSHILQVLDITGREILSGIFQGESCNIDLGDLTPSVYVIRITQKGIEPKVLRLLKQ